MNETQRRQLGQVIMLVVLLAVLAGSTMFMLKSLNPAAPGKPAATTPQATAQPTTAQPEAGADAAAKPADQAAPKKVTEMPEVYTTSGAQAGKSSGLVDAQLNPSMFKVYSLNPPRNPFAVEERWYASFLTEQLPGYPQLKDSSYFESDELYLPDVWNMIPGHNDWSEVSISRDKAAPEYRLDGTNATGDLATKMTLLAPGGVDESYAGPPSREMTEPGWQPAPYPAPGVPDNSDLFPDSSAEGLPHPGDGAGLPSTGTPPPGDSFSCQGVTHRGDKAYALMSYNGQPFIVSVGTVLPPYYKVFKIQDDGVVLQDRRDESSKWIPLTPGGTGGNVAPGGGAVNVPAPDSPIAGMIEPLVEETLQQLFPLLFENQAQ